MFSSSLAQINAGRCPVGINYVLWEINYLMGIEISPLYHDEFVLWTLKPRAPPPFKNLYYVMDSASWYMLLVSCLVTAAALLLVFKLERPAWARRTPGDIEWDLAMMPLGIVVAENHFPWYNYTRAPGKGTIIRLAFLISTTFIVMFFQSVLKVMKVAFQVMRSIITISTKQSFLSS